MRLPQRFIMVIYFIGLLTFCSCEDKKDSPIKDIMISEKLTKEVLGKSLKLMKQGQQLADEGESINEILRILPDNAIVQTNEEAILFFIDGSVPMIINLYKEASSQEITKGGSRNKTRIALKPEITLPLISGFLLQEENELDVVASKRGEEKREEKKALILAPYLADFGNFDDGHAAVEYLQKNKNYKDRIDHITNNISLKDYTMFSNYDLVHLSTHGLRFCDSETFAPGVEIEITYGGDSEFCKTIIDTGIKHNFENIEDTIDFYLSPENVDYVGNIIHHEEVFYLKSSFFEEFYGAGLTDKIWIFSACELGQRSDLRYVMENMLTDSHFFYWSNEVKPEDAFGAYKKFYENLVKEGLDAKRAYEKIPMNLRSNLASTFNDSIATTTELVHQQKGEPRHGIEVIEMKHPEKKNKTIEEGDFYPLVGDFGDGDEEALTLKVELKGYMRSEFEVKQMTLSLKVDEETVLSRKPFLPDEENDEIEVEDLEDHDYGVEVTITDIAIPDVGEKERITLKAYLYFDDEHFSIHEEEVLIIADGIKTTVRGEGNTTILTYSEKTRAMRIESSGSSTPTFMDEEGALYNFDNNSGWIRMNLGGLMGTSMGGIMQGNTENLNNLLEGGYIGQNDYEEATSTATFGEKFNMGSGNLFFPMVEWGIRFRASAFERNTNFKKQLVDCGKPAPCKKFVGVAGQEKGTQATFEPGGRLIKLRYQGKTIDYEYGDFQVQLPEAQEFKLPF